MIESECIDENVMKIVITKVTFLYSSEKNKLKIQ